MARSEIIVQFTQPQSDLKGMHAKAVETDLNAAEQLAVVTHGGLDGQRLIRLVLRNSAILHAPTREYLLKQGDSWALRELIDRPGFALTDGEARDLITRVYAPGRFDELELSTVMLPLLLVSPRLPEDVVRRIYSDDRGGGYKTHCLQRPDVPEDILQEAVLDEGNPARLYAIDNPKLKPTLDFPLRALRLIRYSNGLMDGWLKLYSSWSEDDLMRSRRSARALLEEVQTKVRKDFFDLFASSWPGSAQEFIEYAEMLDN